LKSLANKKVVIDTSIYLYKFLGEDALIENMYKLVSIFHYYRITPIFIFDGKPPEEKRALLDQRYFEKREAEEKYIRLCEQIKNEISVSEEMKKIQIAKMETLKQKFIRIKEKHILSTKELLDAFGVEYYDAEGEADQLCVWFVKEKYAYACMSDDMDMFLYGCNYVIRHISLLNHTAVLYDRNKILADLNMSSKIFNEIMILSGTDYNINNETSLYETVKWYYEYMKYSEKEIKNNKQPYSFYIWLIKHTKYIKNYELLLRTYQLFQLEKNDCLDNYKTENNVTNINFEKLYNVMEKEGFLFVK
jgi:flap endonuclease-1